MSIHVLSWVLKNSPTRLAERLVLIVLADHAGEDGAGSYPSVKTIAEEAGLSERHARRCLRDLEPNHIKAVGPSPFGTTEYRVLMDGQIVRGDKTNKAREDLSKNQKEMSPEPSSKPSSKPSSNTSVSSETSSTNKQKATTGAAPAPAGFAAFWAEYPRKLRKRKAMAAYQKALDNHGSPPILEGVKAWADYWSAEETELRYIPHPTTWLNGEDFLAPPPTVEKPMTQAERDDLAALVRSLSPEEQERRRSAGEHPYDERTLKRLEGSN